MLKKLCISLIIIFYFLSSIAKAASETVEIYERDGAYSLENPPSGFRPVILQIPQSFRYGIDKNTTRDWGINILTYYPRFTSPNDPQNAKYGIGCVGDCNGRILLLVENGARGLARSGSPNRADFVAHAMIKWNITPPFPSNVIVRKLDAEYGFAEVYERKTMMPDPLTGVPSSTIGRTERYYFRKPPGVNYYDLAAVCDGSMTANSCILYFSLRCISGVTVSVNGLDKDYLKKSEDIRDKTDRFVSSMIRYPACG